MTGLPLRQRGGMLFRVVLLIALLVPAVLSSPWYVSYAAPLPDVSALDHDVAADTLVFASDFARAFS